MRMGCLGGDWIDGEEEILRRSVCEWELGSDVGGGC